MIQLMLVNLFYILLSLPFFLVDNVFAQSPPQSPTPTVSVSPSPTSSQSQNSAGDQKLKDLETQIREYQTKISELQNQGRTLSSQIKTMDSQIRLTELRIDEVKIKIENLEKDIAITKKKIVGLEENINTSTKALLQRIAAVYEVGRIDPWQMFLTSDTISNFLTRLKYLKIVQIYDKKNIYAAEQAKVNYANQKGMLEGKQKEEEALKGKLESYNSQLETDRKAKGDLLTVTKNSEKEYQRRLSDALRELQQIQQAAKILIASEPKKVSRGEVVGLMGNTGYSFGAHLHFGVYNVSKLEDYNYYSNHENPAIVLEGKSVNWETECGGDPVGSTNTGSGNFTWPMSTDGLHITQGYGHTCYSNVYYKGNPHPAYDMYNKGDYTVKATEEGQAYFCRNCTGDGANGVFIFHPNGKMTLYWHLQ